MIIEQKTITTIVADEGKLLVKKSDGMVCGKRVTLGYDYYDAGVALSEPRLMKPDDFMEIDDAEYFKQRPVIDQVKRLQRTKELMAQNVKEMNNLKLSASDAIQVTEWFPEFLVDEGFREGETVIKGNKFKYNGKLYAVLQDHTILSHYYPSVNTAALYVEVTPDYTEDGEEYGTLENPIQYEGNMVLENGKYYSQDGVVYLCNRDSINPVYHTLAELVNLYVEVA